MPVMRNERYEWRLSQALDEIGWTQKKLAEAAGLSENTVSRLCNAPSAPSLKTINKICRATGLRVEQLIVAVPEPA